MSEQLELEVAAPQQDNAAQLSEPDAEQRPEQPGGTDAPEQSVAETDEQKNERVQQEAAQKAEKRARGIQKRMDELTRDKYAERQAREELARQNAELLALLKGKTENVPSADDRPTQDQFSDYAEYVKAYAIWAAEKAAKLHARQEAKALLEQNLKEQREAQARQAQIQSEQAVINAYAQRHKEAAKTIPDFEETMAEADVDVPAHVLNMIRRLDNGPIVAYHMVKNPALAQQFFTHPPEMHGILLGQLSATLKGSAKVSNAPPPGRPTQAKSGSANEPPEDTEAYFAWAAKHMR